MPAVPVFYDERESVVLQPPVAASFCGKATVRRPPPFTEQDREGPGSVAPNSCPTEPQAAQAPSRPRSTSSRDRNFEAAKAEHAGAFFHCKPVK